MRGRWRAVAWLAAVTSSTSASTSTIAPATIWSSIEPSALVGIDDDITRNIANAGFLKGISVTEARFSENGFDWHLIRFTSTDKPDGPNWVVPHDDENAAFDGMIAAIQTYGGAGIAVNSGPGSARRQSGAGICGVKSERTYICDPNRNFDARSPVYTAAFVNMFQPGRPVIALHTNIYGFTGDGAGGRGDITIYDRQAFARRKIKPRQHGQFAVNPIPEMANPDSFALSAFLVSQRKPSSTQKACGTAMARSGIHYWHEPVHSSDGSLSNYLALNRPDIRYLNAESRTEADLALAARRHAIMVSAYLEKCSASGDKPGPLP